MSGLNANLCNVVSRRTGRGDSSRNDEKETRGRVASWLRHSAGYTALLLNAAVALLSTPAAALVGSCDSADEVQSYYRGIPAASVTYGGDAAAALLRVLTAIAGAPPGNPAVRVVMGVNFAASDADFFLYDSKDCGIAMMGPVTFGDAAQILGTAGLDSPFHRQSVSRLGTESN
jgi:hypothetical protein